MSAKTPLLYGRQGAAWLARHEIWPVGLGVLLASASLRLAPWGLGLLAVMWGVRWLGQGRPAPRTPVDWSVVVLCGMGGVAWLVTTDRHATGLALSRLLAGVSLLYSSVNWANTRVRLLLLLVGSTVAALGLALATPWLIPWQDAGRLSTVQTYIPFLENRLNPNMVAGALVMLLPFPLAGSLLLLKVKRSLLPAEEGLTVLVKPLRVWRALSLPVALLIGGALFITQSRGAWLATGGVLFMIGLAYTPLFLGVLLLPLLAGGWLVWRGQLGSFLDALGTGGGIVGWDQRMEIWSRALYMIQDFPFTGIGANTYSQVMNVLYPLFLVPPTTVIPHAHNLFLQVGIDLGLPGLIAFLALLLGTLFTAVRGLRDNGDDPVRRVATWAGVASLVAMLIHGMVDVTTWIVGWGAPVPWLILGILLASARGDAATPAVSSEACP